MPCNLIKLFTIYYKTSLRNEIIENEFSVTVDLSPADCELMVRNKRCNNFDMICSDTTSCSYEGVRVPNYEWLKQHTGKESNFFPVKIPNFNLPTNDFCPYLEEYKKCIHTNCAYAHNPLESEIWKFLHENNIHIHHLAYKQQASKHYSIKLSDNKEIFERSKEVHKIVNGGDLIQFKKFIKYSTDSILEDYNEESESILHVAVKTRKWEFIELFLDNDKLRNCFDSNELANCRFYAFVNHKSINGFTAFEWLLNNILIFDSINLERIFKLFLDCTSCEIKEALEICKTKNLSNFEKQLSDRMHFEEF
jgi:hypothetical protein